MLASLSVTNSVQNGLNALFGYIPNIIGFILILLIGYIIARVVRAIVARVLGKLKLDHALERSSAGGFVEKISPGGRPSRFVAAIVFWLIFIYAITAAIGALKIPSVTLFMNKVLSYLPNVIAAAIIFVIAAAVSGVIAAAARKAMGDTPTGKLAMTVIPGLIMAIAVFMILTQLKIAPAIVTITYAALLGMLALAGALAFGLGGREVAAQMLSAAYEKGQVAQQQAQADLQVGKERAQHEVASRTSERPDLPRSTDR